MKLIWQRNFVKTEIAQSVGEFVKRCVRNVLKIQSWKQSLVGGYEIYGKSLYEKLSQQLTL